MASKTDGVDGVGDSLDALFDCLADSRRRSFWGVLYDRGPAPAASGDPAALLGVGRRDLPPDGAARERRRRALSALRRVHSSKMADGGPVEWGPEGVAPADDRAFRDTGVREAVCDAGADCHHEGRAVAGVGADEEPVAPFRRRLTPRLDRFGAEDEDAAAPPLC